MIFKFVEDKDKVFFRIDIKNGAIHFVRRVLFINFAREYTVIY